jgi:hypothetical protein
MSLRRIGTGYLVFCVFFLALGLSILDLGPGLVGINWPSRMVCLAEEPADQSRSQTPWSFLRRAIDNIFASEDPVTVPDRGFASPDAPTLTPIYQEGKHGQGELRLINQVPVLILRGKPEEIGVQEAKLTADAMANLVAAPEEFLRQLNYPGGWEGLVARGRHLWSYVPEEYRRELIAMAHSSGINQEELFAVNVSFIVIAFSRSTRPRETAIALRPSDFRVLWDA